MNTISRNRTLIFIIALLLITNISLLAYLFILPKTPKYDKGKDGFASALKKEVGFSEAQVQQFNAIKQKNWAAAKADMDRIRKLKQQIFDLTKQAAGTDSLVAQLADSIGVLQKGVEINAFNHFKSTRNICTPAQQPAYDSLMTRIIRQGRGKSKISDHSTK